MLGNSSTVPVITPWRLLSATPHEEAQQFSRVVVVAPVSAVAVAVMVMVAVAVSRLLI